MNKEHDIYRKVGKQTKSSGGNYRYSKSSKKYIISAKKVYRVQFTDMMKICIIIIMLLLYIH